MKFYRFFFIFTVIVSLATGINQTVPQLEVAAVQAHPEITGGSDAAFPASNQTSQINTLAFPRAFFPGVNNNLVVSDDGTFGLVGSYETDSVFTFDMATGEQLGEVTVGDGPTQVIVQGTLAAVFNNAFLSQPQPTISIVDVSNPRMPHLVSTCLFPEKRSAYFTQETLSLSRDGQVVFGTVVDKKGRGTLFAFNTQTGEQLGTLALGDFPVQLALREKDGKRLLAITSTPDGPHNLFLVDATNPRALRQQAVYRFPDRGALSLSNTVLLSDSEDFGYIAIARGQLLAFSTTTAEILSRTTLPILPARLQRRGNRMLVQHDSEALITVLDLTEPLAPKQVSQVEFTAEQLLYSAPRFSPDGTRGYALVPFEQRVEAFDIETGEHLGSAKVSDEIPFAFAVGTTSENPVCAVMTTSERRVDLVRSLPNGFEPVGNFETPTGVAFTIKQVPVVTADGTKAYIASPLTDEVLEISLETNAVTARLTTDDNPETLSIYENAPERRLAVTTRGGSSVNLFRLNETGEWETTGSVNINTSNPFLLDYSNVVFSPDGKTGFVTDVETRVYAFETDGGAVLSSLEVGPFPAQLGFVQTPDGNQLLAVTAGSLGEDSTITVLNVNDPREMQPVSTTRVDKEIQLALDNRPLFSTDGKQLYLGASFSGELLVIDVAKEQIINQLKGITGVVLNPFQKNGKPAFITANLDDGKILILERDQAQGLRKSQRIKPPQNNYFIVSNLPVIFADNENGAIASYGLQSLLFFNINQGQTLNQIQLPGAPGRVALVPGSQTLLTVEINGSANRIFRIEN